MLNSFFGFITVLTGMQLEQQLDGEVVEVTTVLDNLDEWRQPTLARCEGGDGDGCVELTDHWERNQRQARTDHVLKWYFTPEKMEFS